MTDYDQRVTLTYDQAVALLPDGDTIHTMMDGAFGILGADWDREAILDLLRTGRPELAGPIMTENFNHGIVVFRGDGYAKPMFIETKREEK